MQIIIYDIFIVSIVVAVLIIWWLLIYSPLMQLILQCGK